MREFTIECDHCGANYMLSIEDILDWLTTPELRELKGMLTEMGI